METMGRANIYWSNFPCSAIASCSILSLPHSKVIHYCSAVNALSWAHQMALVEDPTQNDLVKNVLAVVKRINEGRGLLNNLRDRDNLSTTDNIAGTKVSAIRRFDCSIFHGFKAVLVDSYSSKRRWLESIWSFVNVQSLRVVGVTWWVWLPGYLAVIMGDIQTYHKAQHTMGN